MKFLTGLGLIVILNLQLQARIIMQPYLQAVTKSSVFVLVECDTRDTVTVQLGELGSFELSSKTTAIYTTTASPVTYVHKVKCTGLKPATLYNYKVGQDTSISKIFKFYTAPDEGMPFRMAWMAGCINRSDVFNKIIRLMNKADPMVALYGTILCEDDGYQAWKDDFFIDAQLDFASRVPFSSRKAGPEGLHQNTNAFTQSPDTLNDMNGFYAFDFGDLHVLYLNTSFPFGKGSPQYLFAEKDLAATQQPWKIVVADKPAYSRGGQSENKDLIEMTRAIFEAQKVDLVLSVNGIHHLVAGTAQEPLQNQVGEPYTLFQSNQDHFAVLDIAKSKIKIFIYNENNEIIENFEITK